MQRMAQSPSSASNFSDNALDMSGGDQRRASWLHDNDSPKSQADDSKTCCKCAKGRKRTINSILIIWACVGAAAMATEGLLCLSRVICHGFNIREQIISLYYGIFGMVVLCAEFQKFMKLLQFFNFLKYRTGRACFYFFLGTIAISDEVLSIIIAASWILLGIANLVAACYCLDNKLAKKEQAKEQAYRDWKAQQEGKGSSDRYNEKTAEPLRVSAFNENGQGISVDVPPSAVKGVVKAARDNIELGSGPQANAYDEPGLHSLSNSRSSLNLRSDNPFDEDSGGIR